MSKNLIENGGFDTGDFRNWTVQDFGTQAKVVQYNRSSQAKMQPGKDTGQLLFTRFDAKSGRFAVTIDASAPGAEYDEDPPQWETHPVLVFLFSGFSAEGSHIQTDIGTWWLKRSQKRFEYVGNMLPEVANVEVRFSFPSDPLVVKGPLYIDNVSYTLNPPEQLKTLRWSR
ncbi:hypothetical protein ACYZT2_22835 [Pseudomonas sp. MDT1-85]